MPGCSKKRLVKYIDTTTGVYLPEQYGRCDREVNCNYHLNPYSDGYGIDADLKPKPNYKAIPKPKPPPPPPWVFIPGEVLKQTLQGYEQNTFLQNLLTRIPSDEIEKVVSLHYLGTIAEGYRAGAITFPFIDIAGNVRAIQVKEFNETNHTTGTGFYHSLLAKQYANKKEPVPVWLEGYLNNERKASCLFGGIY